jgi:pimeloyl-ACP methyl ester carboxylesterase
VKNRGRWMAGGVLALLVALAAGAVLFVLHPIGTAYRLQRRTLASAGFERVVLGEGDARLTLFEAGSGPAILFLHGLGDQAGTWSKIAPAFLADHRVVLVDLPGHGDSAPASGPLTMASELAGAERALQRAAADGPAFVVGNSLGGWLATLLAARHPGEVARLVLVDGGPLRGEPGGPSLQPQDRREAARLMGMLRDASAPQLPGFVLDDVVRRSANGPIARLAADLPGLEAHLLDAAAVAAVRTPTDLLWGASDRLVPPAYAERLAAALPASRLTWVERCGHIPQVECPQRFLQALETVLASPPPADRTEGSPAAAPEAAP